MHIDARPSSVLCCKVLDIPKRPPWDYKMNKQAVESQESRMFEAYLQEIYKHYKPDKLSHFEHNLEVWQSFTKYIHGKSFTQ